MALKKSIPSPSGASATYWRIGGIMLHDWERRFQIYLLGYVDEDKRRATDEAGAPKFQHLSMAVFEPKPEQWAELFGESGVDVPSKATLYEYLKTTPEWVGAKDV